MHLFVVRHGQCETVSGTPDTALTPLGERQARETGRRLAREGITRILSSPMVRALGTACIIADEVGERPVEVWPELREVWNSPYRSFGRGDLLRCFPRAILPPEVLDDGWEHGGDTYESLFARCQRAMERMEAELGRDDRVVLVAHGGLSNYLLHAILHIPPTMPAWFEMGHCAITRVRLVPEEGRAGWPLYPPVAAEILCTNDVSHLTEPTGVPREMES